VEERLMNDEKVEDLKDLIGYLSDRVMNVEKAVENHNVKEAMCHVAYAEVRLSQIKQALFEASK
jgi:hypothetical protein